ncbi:hypothetical protein CEXT_432741 [Caerostris extrusa]|uniref:Uncharacterized protein n=1 Tax=Caerostris extrusa TaxID=172846 RepID=A0AAV4PN99_CAEEX|nr:hypothetical protein CEXT_432741 [Caerostris extrusa]
MQAIVDFECFKWESFGKKNGTPATALNEKGKGREAPPSQQWERNEDLGSQDSISKRHVQCSRQATSGCVQGLSSDA